MAGKFVLAKNAKGQYRFSLKAANGETIAQSEMYPTARRRPRTASSRSRRTRPALRSTTEPENSLRLAAIGSVRSSEARLAQGGRRTRSRSSQRRRSFSER